MKTNTKRVRHIAQVLMGILLVAGLVIGTALPASAAATKKLPVKTTSTGINASLKAKEAFEFTSGKKQFQFTGTEIAPKTTLYQYNALTKKWTIKAERVVLVRSITVFDDKGNARPFVDGFAKDDNGKAYRFTIDNGNFRSERPLKAGEKHGDGENTYFYYAWIFHALDNETTRKLLNALSTSMEIITYDMLAEIVPY